MTDRPTEKASDQQTAMRGHREVTIPIIINIRREPCCMCDGPRGEVRRRSTYRVREMFGYRESSRVNILKTYICQKKNFSYNSTFIYRPFLLLFFLLSYLLFWPTFGLLCFVNIDPFGMHTYLLQFCKNTLFLCTLWKYIHTMCLKGGSNSTRWKSKFSRVLF